MVSCAFCGADIGDPRAVVRRSTCAHCGRDLHTCLQCRFYDPSSHHQCREPKAEWVKEKDAANFCDFFEVYGAKRPELSGVDAVQVKARGALDALFRKK